MLRLKVGAALAVPVLSKIMSSRPCVKEQRGLVTLLQSLVSFWFWLLPVEELPFYHLWMSN